MPDGVLKWFDAKTGTAEVIRAGRTFPARASDIETAARRPGARVHFDIRREHGVEYAVDVRLRVGTRVSRHQHRFGTLAGAHRGDAKGTPHYARLHPELHAAARHPLEIARAWATSLVQADLDGALALYAPDATVHVGTRTLSGRDALAAWLADTAVFDSQRHPRIRGDDGMATVSWSGAAGSEPGMLVRCRIEHGEITEQWVSEHEAPTQRLVADHARPLAFELSTSGEIDDATKRSAEESILRELRKRSEPVLFVRVKLAWEPDPARIAPATAQVSVDVNGDLVRAQVAAPTMPEAIDRLGHRLRDRLEHRARHRERLHRSSALAAPGEWRHGDLPTHRRPFFDRPVEERQLVRHKTFALGELTPDEAVFDMDQLDYDFYLFTDLASGSDSLVERLEDGTYRLTRIESLEADLGPTATEIEVSKTPVPVLDLAAAIERLNAGEEPHVFFKNATTGRANVLYRRYDGHYGLITPE